MSNSVDVQRYGQSIWLDYIHRKDLNDGTLQRYIDDGVMGVTSNPAIFQKAIGESDTYDDVIGKMLNETEHTIYETLAIEDIQHACDIFKPVYERTGGRDGYVSLEVSPQLAHDTEKTIAEAERLYKEVGRPNVMIKIPATPEGIPAVEEVISKGINVNITLIFSVENYIQVAEAYLRGLERRLEAGGKIDMVASVASFFLSRIDSAVDRILHNNIRVAQVHGDTTRIAANRHVLGQAAIANAKLAYKTFQRLFAGERWQKLHEAGAHIQRPLWASTGTKDSAYSDTRYVDRVIGQHTVNTVPPKTLAAFQDHGTVIEDAILQNQDDFLPPEEVFKKLSELGVDFDQITHRLQVDGVDAFIESFEKLLEQVRAKRTVLDTGIMARQRVALGIYADAVTASLDELDKKYVPQRIWSKDGSVWKDHGPTISRIKNRLGWLDVLLTIEIERLVALREATENSGFETVVLLGMGGSSLAPEVFFRVFGKQEGFPALMVLDSTDPLRVQQIRDSINIDKTLFIVASKSGGTIETLSFYKYFWQETGGKGEQFIAITDEGSKLQAIAQENNFRDIFVNPSDIGGRYSALSYFGLVPAALMGVDVALLWERAKTMISACHDTVPSSSQPAAYLGAIIGTLAKKGRDKVSIYSTQSLASFGDWAEQLVAESLGKEDKGVIPVVGATIGKPHDYVTDRLFVYLRIDDDEDREAMDAGIRALREAGHPRITIRLADKYDLAGEFFRWEFATAVAGALLDVNPFDEPNVTEAKEATKALLAHYEEHGTLPETEPIMQGEHVSLFSDEHTVAPLRELCRAHGYDDNSRTEVLAAQITGTQAGDYFALLVYTTPDETTLATLKDIQRRLRHVTKRAVTLGFGPRYLHSTGQLHKGGANNGVFFQITTNRDADVEIPDAPYSFGTLFDAQAAGDLEALFNHERRAFRFHIDGDVNEGLQKLLAAIDFVEQRRI
jgi:transaldolase/glucose-6-phosphate isomerase